MTKLLLNDIHFQKQTNHYCQNCGNIFNGVKIQIIMLQMSLAIPNYFDIGPVAILLQNLISNQSEKRESVIRLCLDRELLLKISSVCSSSVFC